MDAPTKRVRQTYIGDTLYIVESLQSDTATQKAHFEQCKRTEKVIRNYTIIFRNRLDFLEIVR